MTLEREKIIKELEGLVKFSTCPEYIKNALSLIKELSQAHEQLSESYDHLEKTKDELLSERARLTEENERLKKDNEYILMQHAFQRRPSGDCWNDVIEKAKADTVRKMQEDLKSCFCPDCDYSGHDVRRVIDIKPKELVGVD